MITFLTSSFIVNTDKESYIPSPLMDSNDFIYNLKKYWKDNSNILIIASDPEDFPENDFKKKRIMDGFSLAGFSIENVNIYDHRNNEDIKKMIHWADVIYLSGGHCPTENKFIKETGLKEALKEFNGIFIGLSAGSVNAASSVFLIPEEKGEAIDKDFIYFTEGLGLTDINIIPHSGYLKEVILDGKHMMNDIFIPFSYERKLYLLPDGSYFMIKDGETQLFGEAEVLFDGKIYPIKTGMVHTFDRMIKADEWKVISNAGYDAVFKVDIENDKIDFIHYSDFFKKKGFDDLRVRTYRGFLDAVAGMIVDEERKAMDDGTALDLVIQEIEKTGIFVATFHVDTEEGTRAENVRIFRTVCKGELMCIIVDIAFTLDHDWMTDIYSRIGFIRTLKNALPSIGSTNNYSLCFTNILNFKAINNLFGEKKGDLIIFQERDALRNGLKPLLIGHLDADHYALVVENRYLEKENLKKVCRQIYKEKYKQYVFHIRLGVYPIENPDVSVTHMLDCAKLAENKINEALNENIRVYDGEMITEYDMRHILIQDLSDGIRNKDIIPYYQPIVDTRTGEIVSAEALVRWKHLSMGMLPPSFFITTFEENGEISKITRYMMDAVASLGIERRNKGLVTVPCAVNLSRMDFYDPLLMDETINKIASIKDIDKLIKVEVTESAYAVLEKEALYYLNKLKKLGIKVLLDDYGSGMSSLSTLETFEFDTIKLDMGFVKKIGVSKAAEAIIRTTIGMAHALGADVVAEGVETELQREFLLDAECDMIQGYLFYKPVDSKQFEEILNKEK